MSVKATDESVGLAPAEAGERLKTEGPNELPSGKKRGLPAIAFDVVREPMFLLLVFAGSLYAALGDLQEASMLLGFVFVVMGITVYQERKTERALEALRDLASPKALVLRGGEQIHIPSREVVRGDIVVIAEGDRVPADAVLVSSDGLQADESLLTGESVPVRKLATLDRAADLSTTAKPGGDDLPMVFAGTLVVQGHGLAQVTATGAHSEIGRIGVALESTEREPTDLQRHSRRLVRNMALVGLSVCVLVVLVYGFTRGQWTEGLLAGITLAMATLPEEIPVVLTVFLALGAWRISQKRVLTRRIPAVESLGSATVLCVDKTGTLTQNRMTIVRLFSEGRSFTVPEQTTKGKRTHEAGKSAPLDDPTHEAFHQLVEYGILASEPDPFDPMEKAFKELGTRYFSESEHLHDDWVIAHEYSLSRELLAMSHVWTSRSGDTHMIAAKGAPEAIADLCHLDATRRAELAREIDAMADDGLRVLGVARAEHEGKDWPAEQHDFDFMFLGLVGLSDPPRPAVAESLAQCRSAGVRVIMITGDYPGTARAIARQIGLGPAENVITGPELEEMSDEELQARLGDCNIFARMVPEQKLKLVRALKARGELVAMTGDGVNDAPALKAANIGVAMGQRGTDVAREASSLVLLDDDFSSIVAAIRMGRRIFDNLKKAIAYVFAVHTPIIGLTLIPLAAGWPLLFSPIHVVFLELLIDPACSVAFEAEPEEKGVMQRPPRPAKEPLFGRRVLGLSILQGLVVLAILAVLYGVALASGQGTEKARALTFTALIFANLALIFTNRSWTTNAFSALRVRNAALWWIVGAALAVLALVLYVPALRDLFGFGVLSALDVLLCLVAGVISVAWFEVFKAISGSRARRASA